ncbi:hypothetical protein GUITHDRAFT_117854 [Guillardia theta CCMP2712]|uniref:Uncharacterized protein n=1 Tax=Guillardia theta (strain CCMP2712) TaxID=905079 RepID=L1IJF1_GUITC|nr:hypothetical protein GUITHDRAFT_117854 [Guillardia theta CCMP2712]EKX35940.1 hypothetical protein GUITHDRAFT_117854 [Guillardia theta CCMP2712]|eukprot:XP_005822920.1 hypothetical protein GUITHDRAFT_117854 [Guillardia theta CCMP2712]
MLFRSFLCLTLVAATAATTCYISEKKATNGGCPETTFKYGSCASKAVADAGVDALIAAHKLVAPADNAACKAKIDAQCAGVVSQREAGLLAYSLVTCFMIAEGKGIRLRRVLSVAYHSDWMHD